MTDKRCNIKLKNGTRCLGHPSFKNGKCWRHSEFYKKDEELLENE